MWARQFDNNDFDIVFLFAHASGSSAYNPVKRGMTPLSKDPGSMILLFDTFGNYLDASNKTVDLKTY